jgi:hypothetical protein
MVKNGSLTENERLPLTKMPDAVRNQFLSSFVYKVLKT